MNEKCVVDFFQSGVVAPFLIINMLVFCLLLFTILVFSLLIVCK